MSLVDVNLPPPSAMRGGWAALAAVLAARGYAADAPGLEGMPPSDEALRALVSADAQITHQMLQRVIPGWDVEAGVAAAPKFLEMPV
ncbi:hypothetical protein [Fischerella thermalis]|uniref:hypothetical protein n=1 Tax=Fischerella thermalis TaxID=372787 RepID=UPI0019E756B7|nr:hypothetical protein [Fischerella thermalis]MBF1989130.1 hypothetical protein [Fischerella thermalis M58_A2018_009]MBF2070543.1 hypothetical protein [Fischerella thermalis M48_A2018_028]